MITKKLPRLLILIFLVSLVMYASIVIMRNDRKLKIEKTFQILSTITRQEERLCHSVCDAWGRTIQIQEIEDGITATSFGNDGISSADDIVMEIKNKSENSSIKSIRYDYKNTHIWKDFFND